MLPSQTRLHGWTHPPNIDYSFKHSFSWPQQQLAEAAQAAQQATTAGATAAEGAAAGAAHGAHFTSGGGGGYPPRGPGSMHYHWYGRGVPRYGRFRGPRRLVWFGLGFGAAAWYFAHKERERQWRQALTSGNPPTSQKDWYWGCENVKKDQHWGHGWHNGWNRSSSPSPPSSPVTPPVNNNITPPAYASAPVKEPSSDFITESAVLAALSQARKAEHEVEHKKDNGKSEPSWGWGERRRRRREAKEEAQRDEQARQFATSTTSDAPVSTHNQSGEEMKRLREAVEDLWADRKGAILTAQERADQKAREYAREKIERMSVALESLRESLKKEGEQKRNEKLV